MPFLSFNAHLLDDINHFFRKWIAHRSPRFLEVSGSCIKESFSMKAPFDYDLYDQEVLRIAQLDSTLYQDSTGKHWRHILESDFAVCCITLSLNTFTSIEFADIM
jgi:hypothetical protein